MAKEVPLELELDPIDPNPQSSGQERDELLERLRDRDTYKKARAGTFPDWMNVRSV